MMEKTLDQTGLGEDKSREKREIVKLSDTVKAILDSLKNTVVDYVCRSDVVYTIAIQLPKAPRVLF